MGALLSSPYLATGDFPLMPPHTRKLSQREHEPRRRGRAGANTPVRDYNRGQAQTVGSFSPRD